jgi:hypothetical protein
MFLASEKKFLPSFQLRKHKLKPIKVNQKKCFWVCCGTVTKFFTGIRQGTAHRPTFGKSTIIGLEPTLRTAINESVKIAYNLDIVVNTSLFSKKKLIIPSANTHETLSN